MTPVDMQVKHDPTTDSVGDCFRCCIASILELDPAEVPHFMELDWDYEKHEWVKGNYRWYTQLQRWLKPRGFAYFEIRVTPEIHADGKWFANLEPAFEVYHVLGGRSPRDDHAVVARNGRLAHDPAPQKDGHLLKPTDDGHFTYGFLLVRGGVS